MYVGNRIYKVRKWILLGFLFGAMVPLLLGLVWDVGFEGTPDGATALVSDLDTRIQELKREIRRRGGVESAWGPSGTANDHGLHWSGSARVFNQNAAPTDMLGDGGYDNAAEAFVGTLLTTTEPGASTDDQGRGRLWADLDGEDTDAVATRDDQELNIWDETANGFTEVRAVGIEVPVHNLIYNGSFEITDGTGDTGSMTVPAGWALVLTPTLAYVDPTAVTEGEGLALRTTGAGAAQEGVQHTLVNLKADTTYVVRARVNATAGDTCNLNVTGGQTTPVTATSATTGVYETLEADIETTAVPANIVVQLRSTADTDVCDWDHVSMFERAPVSPPPGRMFCYDTDTSAGTTYGAGAFTAVPGLSCAVTIPGPGYAIQVDALVTADNQVGSNEGLEVELREDCGVAATVAHAVGNADDNDAGDIDDIVSVPIHYMVLADSSAAPSVGETCTYTLRAAGGAGASWTSNENAGDADLVGTAESTLRVQLIPTG